MFRRYKDSILKIRAILEDQPMKGMEKIIWWIEYVLRHNGTSHLRDSSAALPWYQYYLLDVISILLLFCILSLYIPYKIVTLLNNFRRNPTKFKTKTKWIKQNNPANRVQNLCYKVLNWIYIINTFNFIVNNDLSFVSIYHCSICNDLFLQISHRNRHVLIHNAISRKCTLISSFSVFKHFGKPFK